MTGPWNARPASPAPTSPAIAGWRPSAGGRSCSPRRWGIDARMREGLALRKTPYLHMLRMPLPQAVALDEAAPGADGQRDGFGNECEGHCGV